MIQASADAFFVHFLDAWTKAPDAIPADVRYHYLAASAAAVPSTVADYRASAGVDVDPDTADREAGNRLAMPVTVLQQNWGAALGYHAQGPWSAWAGDLDPKLIADEIRSPAATEPGPLPSPPPPPRRDGGSCVPGP